MEGVLLERISKSYHKDGQVIDIMDQVTLQVPVGTHLAIQGPSGSGKTTLLNLISGLDSADSGNIWVCGQNLSLMPEYERTAFRNKHVGLVFQDYCLLPGLTALENVKLVCSGDNQVELERAKILLVEMGLGSRLNFVTSQLSGGEQQRVAIARALVKQPSIILADEPTAQLDRRSAELIMDVIIQMQRQEQVTMVTVTHDENVANKCDHINYMDRL
ncbi:ABC transporter ATP-binding protein [Candidatus Comchoanobacter bicostacola]|uniref:ABC transporter ATP-binding protein n=1 Tax=Candidatus Comchoanobacter bicostacola TaxID=2919598 RepID=A0ABY5DMX3_9GAMM|nr:ABC transporter ATP-binding protein [Candidatus Comchoanobacter bicostacola]UTC24910.1 ABC transporter ATP-binding protein [Candidatus Comchoanobacter bicostacola]